MEENQSDNEVSQEEAVESTPQEGAADSTPSGGELAADAGHGAADGGDNAQSNKIKYAIAAIIVLFVIGIGTVAFLMNDAQNTTATNIVNTPVVTPVMDDGVMEDDGAMMVEEEGDANELIEDVDTNPFEEGEGNPFDEEGEGEGDENPFDDEEFNPFE